MLYMKYHRKVKLVTKIGRLQNNDIKEVLQISSMPEETKKQQLKCLDHIDTINDRRPVKQILEAIVGKSKTWKTTRRIWNHQLMGT